MTTDRINAAMAEVEGYKPDPFGYYVKDPAGLSGPRFRADELPAYTLDINATQRVLRGLDERGKVEAVILAAGIAFDPIDVAIGIALAAPLQWCEAILRATGKWEDGE